MCVIWIVCQGRCIRLGVFSKHVDGIDSAPGTYYCPSPVDYHIPM